MTSNAREARPAVIMMTATSLATLIAIRRLPSSARHSPNRPVALDARGWGKQRERSSSENHRGVVRANSHPSTAAHHIGGIEKAKPRHLVQRKRQSAAARPRPSA